MPQPVEVILLVRVQSLLELAPDHRAADRDADDGLADDGQHPGLLNRLHNGLDAALLALAELEDAPSAWRESIELVCSPGYPNK